MTEPQTKAEVERELLDAWQSLASAVDSVSLEEMKQPGVVDGWSLKDLLGHIAFWAEKAADDLRKVTAGHPEDVLVPGGQVGTDEWNEREAQYRKDRPLAQVREEWEKSFESAKEALRATPAETLDVEVKGWTMLVRFQEDTYNHYREHAEQIRAWRRQLETTEA